MLKLKTISLIKIKQTIKTFSASFFHLTEKNQGWNIYSDIFFIAAKLQLKECGRLSISNLLKKSPRRYKIKSTFLIFKEFYFPFSKYFFRKKTLFCIFKAGF